MKLNIYQKRIVLGLCIIITILSIFAVPVTYVYPEGNFSPSVKKVHFSLKPVWTTGSKIGLTLPVIGKKNTWSGRIVDIKINFKIWFLINLVIIMWAGVLFLYYSDKEIDN